jgi:molecular chaperone HscB
LNIARIRFEAMLDVLLNELKSLWNHWDAVIEKTSAEEAERIVIRDRMVALLNRRSYARNLVRDVNAALQT